MDMFYEKMRLNFDENMWIMKWRV